MLFHDPATDPPLLDAERERQLLRQRWGLTPDPAYTTESLPPELRAPALVPLQPTPQSGPALAVEAGPQQPAPMLDPMARMQALQQEREALLRQLIAQRQQQQQAAQLDPAEMQRRMSYAQIGNVIAPFAGQPQTDLVALKERMRRPADEAGDRLLEAQLALLAAQTEHERGIFEAKRSLAEQLFNVGGEIVAVGPDGTARSVWKAAQDALKGVKTLPNGEIVQVTAEGVKVLREGRRDAPSVQSTYVDGKDRFALFDDGSTVRIGSAAETAPLDTKGQLAAASTLRGDFARENKANADILAATAQLEASAAPYFTIANTADGGQQAQNQAAADLALISGFARLLDPGSVVRPEEGRVIGQLGGWADKLDAYVRQASSGKPLGDEQRRALLSVARDRAAAADAAAARLRGDYRERARRHGLDPRDIVGAEVYTPSPGVTGYLNPGAQATPGTRTFDVPDEKLREWGLLP